MLTFAITLNFIDRGALLYAQEPIIEEYGLNAAAWGHVLVFLDMAIFLEDC